MSPEPMEMTHPAPLVAPDVDLRKLEYMPLHVRLLLNSDFFVQATDAEIRAALHLWCEAWHQVPAASLPDNEHALCKLAGLGRDLASWKQVRDGAMSGFVLCSDGRYYHEVIALLAADAWKECHHLRRISAMGVEARKRKRTHAPPQDQPRGSPPSSPPGNSSGTPSAQPADTPQGAPTSAPVGELSRSRSNINHPEKLIQPGAVDNSKPGDEIPSQNRRVRSNDTASVRRTRELVTEQREQKTAPPTPKAAAAMASVGKQAPWWKTPAGVAKRGRELDVMRQPGQSFESFRFLVCERATIGKPPYPWLEALSDPERDAILRRARGDEGDDE